MLFRLLFLVFSSLLLTSKTLAEVTRIEISSQAPFAGGKSFGATGPYLRVIGRYQDKTSYLSRVRSAAQELQRRGFYLEEDIDKTVDRVARNW
jgi:hypothetical protein